MQVPLEESESTAPLKPLNVLGVMERVTCPVMLLLWRLGLGGQEGGS